MNPIQALIERIHLTAKDKDISIVLLVAIPRSNATLVERTLMTHPDIADVLHEPFLASGYYGKNLEDDLLSILNKLASLPRHSTLLIKEMAHWLGFTAQHPQFLKIFKSPILLQIKNPILTIESKITTSLRTTPRKERPELIDILSQNLQAEKPSTTKKALNLFAEKNNYDTWEQMAQESICTRDYRALSDILVYYTQKESGDFWGWQDLQNFWELCIKHHMPYAVLEGSDFTAQPEQVCKTLCSMMGINYIPHMTQWNPDKKEAFKKILNQPHAEEWYESACSHPISHMEKTPIPLFALPPDIAEYINKTAMPIYTSLCEDENRIY